MIELIIGIHMFFELSPNYEAFRPQLYQKRTKWRRTTGVIAGKEESQPGKSDHASSSSVGTSSRSLPTIASATFHTCSKLSSAAEQSTHGSLRFQLKSEMRLVCPPCMKRLKKEVSHPKNKRTKHATSGDLQFWRSILGIFGCLFLACSTEVPEHDLPVVARASQHGLLEGMPGNRLHRVGMPLKRVQLGLQVAQVPDANGLVSRSCSQDCL